jgi:glycosyltransferase involved in cell wall biosynthesis
MRLIVDVRCLQDPNYGLRGVGQHVRTLLRYRRKDPAATLRFRLIGVRDRDLPPLTAEDRELFEEVRTTAYEICGSPTGFLSTSPMTHSPLPLARLMMRDDIFRAAIIYDFIPHDMPQRYLASEAARVSYATCLAWLRRFHHFFPISEHTAQRLSDLLGIERQRCTVTGVAVRESLRPMQSHTPAPATPIILVVGGGDSRKNPEVAVIAHARSWRLAAAGIPLLVAGDYPECMQRDLRQLHAMSDGNPQLLEFLPSVPDEELQSCYARALCTVAPSRIEGFSIPIIEASANGCPVLASKCAAQAELLTATEDLFDPDDAETLRERLEQIVLNPAARKAACARQSDIWRRFTLEEVGNRFWQAMIAGWEASAPAVLRGKRPRIAFLSPLPPAVSGVADYSFAMLSPLAARADVEVFSGTADARTPRGVRVMGSTNALAHLESRFDAVITIIGNSHIHIPEFELLLRYGGAAIAHDARMVDFYRFLLSEDRALAVASDELGRPVDRDELNTWLADQGRLEALFLKEIAEAARPICVHSPITARYIAERYGITPVKLPFVPYRNFRAEDISPTARLMARDRLGIGHNEVIVASFGMVHPVKALEDCLWVLEILRAWKIPARLVFVGETPRDFSKWLFETARAIGVMEALTVFERPVPEQEYRLWLVAADVGLQLRIYQLGGLSGAILDCMAAALPTVANAHLAEACEAPSYMQCVPDAISAVLVAETIASIIDKGQHLHRPIPERDAMLETRNFDVYTECLLNALGAQ